MNARELELGEWIIGTFGVDANTACILACSYDSDELENMEYIKSELTSWEKTNEMFIGLGIFKKI